MSTETKVADGVKQITVSVYPADLERLDKWRSRQPGVPGRSEALRRLIAAAPLCWQEDLRQNPHLLVEALVDSCRDTVLVGYPHPMDEALRRGEAMAVKWVQGSVAKKMKAWQGTQPSDDSIDEMFR